MRELRQMLRFANETGTIGRVDAVARQLDGDAAAQLRIDGLVDIAKTALADFPHQFVSTHSRQRAEKFAGSKRCRLQAFIWPERWDRMLWKKEPWMGCGATHELRMQGGLKRFAHAREALGEFLHVDTKAGRAAPARPDVLERVRELVEKHSGREWPERAGRRIALQP